MVKWNPTACGPIHSTPTGATGGVRRGRLGPFHPAAVSMPACHRAPLQLRCAATSLPSKPVRDERHQVVCRQGGDPTARPPMMRRDGQDRLPRPKYPRTNNTISPMTTMMMMVWTSTWVTPHPFGPFAAHRHAVHP